MAGEILRKDAPHILLRGSRGRAVIVRQVEVGDPLVKSPPHDPPGFLKIIHMPEVVPEAEGNFRKKKAGVSAVSVVHAATLKF